MADLLGQRGARPKTERFLRQRTRPILPGELEQVVLKRLCDCGGSLSLTALKEALTDEGWLNARSSEAALRDFLTNHSQHNVQLFRLVEDRRECTVRAKTDAVLCQTYNPRRDTCQQGPNCQGFHLCSHFVSDRCRRGRNCRWPHNLGSFHNLNILDQNGLAHLNEDHVLLILRQSWIDITVPDTCKHYNTQSGCHNADCQFLHVCGHYVLGDCRFSNPHKQVCHNSHNLHDPQPVRVWRRFHVDALSKSPRELLQMLQEKKKQETFSDDEDEPDEDEEEGMVMMSSGNQSNKTLPNTCIHYNGKGCTNGDRCSFFHICSFHVIGKCKFSIKCRRSHDVKSSQPMAVWQKISIDAHGKSPEELLDLIRSKTSSEKLGEDGGKLRTASLSQHDASSDNLEKTEICEYNLRGKCNFGDGCRKVHSEEYYKWQYSDGNTWMNCATNAEVEEAFCDITKDNILLNIRDHSKSSIDFKTMKLIWTPSQGPVHSLDVRRLETPTIKTSEVNSWQRVLSTNWQWYFPDNDGIWVQYTKNAEIEEAYQTFLSTGQDKKFDFETKQFRYELDFSRMRQKNKQTGTEREVRRRPKFVTKEAIDRNLQKTKVLGVILPKTWDLHLCPDDPQNNFVLCNLDPELNKEDYELVSGCFAEKMDAKFIRKIERVQNNELWHEFTVKRDHMRDKQEDTTKDPEELLLFHGTEKHVVQAICQQNFDFRMSGTRVGQKYGQGSYFSKCAKYSDSYASADSSGRRRMFLVRVLAGSYTAGNPSYRRPPLKDPSKPHSLLFDSCVDNPIDPLIFVIFERSQAYPEYLITYKK